MYHNTMTQFDKLQGSYSIKSDINHVLTANLTYDLDQEEAYVRSILDPFYLLFRHYSDFISGFRC